MRMKSVLPVLAILLQAGAASAAVCGDAYFNHDIDWPSTPALYYSVAGAPPNTCGDLMASRNGGAYTRTAGWICTDSNGTATKGPWSSNPIDETANVYIDWGTCTSPVRSHIWDVSPPTVNITSSVPGAFSGTATDGTWGAGFNASWTACLVNYRDNYTGQYWDPSSGGYTSSSAVWITCSVSGMPSKNVTWNTSSTTRPAPFLHVTGRAYIWSAWMYDGGQWSSRFVNFTY